MLTLIFRGEAGRCPLIYILFTSYSYQIILQLLALCYICYNLYCSTCVFCSGSPSIVLSCPRIDFSFVTKHSDLVREARTGGAGD